MIGIVVPVLNEERLLPDCLRSLIGQDYKGEYEIVVVDNGSTDRSVKTSKRQYRNPIFLAKKRIALDAGQYLSPANLARQLQFSGVRVTQILNLRKLSPQAINIALFPIH